MKLTVEIQRVGQSRSSFETVPLVASVVQGGKAGANLLAGQTFRDLECAKDHVQTALDSKFGRAVEINWLDQTGDAQKEAARG